MAQQVFIHILLIVFGALTWVFVLISFLPTECKIHPGQIGSPKFVEICGNGYANRMMPWGFSGCRVLAWLLVSLGCFVTNTIYFFTWIVTGTAEETDKPDARLLKQGIKHNLVLGLLLLVFAVIGSEPAIGPQVFYSLFDDELHCEERRIFRLAVCRTIKLFHVCMGLFFSLLMSSLHFLLYASCRKAYARIQPQPGMETDILEVKPGIDPALPADSEVPPGGEKEREENNSRVSIQEVP
jgi:hypothetical protein